MLRCRAWMAGVVLAVATLGASAGRGLAAADGSVQEALQREVTALAHRATPQAGAAGIRGSDLLAEFYRRRDWRPAWTRRDDLDRLRAALADSEAQGLRPEDYLPAPDDAPSRGSEAQARLDLRMTEALIDLALDVRYGRVRAARLDRQTLTRRPLRSPDPVADLEDAVAGGRFDELVDSLEPRTEFYRGLKQALAQYRRLAAEGGWPLAAAGPTLKPGDRDARVATLRERLAATGDLARIDGAQNAPPAAPPAEADLYDDATVDGVKAFQARHGLAADGVLGQQTLAALRVPVDRRIDQIRATLERGRWFLRDLPDRFVMVNVAGFRVLLIDHGEVRWQSRAIVGKPETRTPMFRANLRSVILNPTWTVPDSILRNEYFPAMRRDPSFLARRHIRLVNGRYVQDSGPENSLGRLKLNMPNPHSVYLHDTPSKSLFGSTTRAFSHGCVRVERPLELAALALDDPQWSVDALKAAIDTGATREIVLRKPLAVFVLYWSVTVGRDGRVEFLPDLYLRDEEVLRELDAREAVSPDS